jgi:hypothetical protein
MRSRVLFVLLILGVVVAVGMRGSYFARLFRANDEATVSADKGSEEPSPEMLLCQHWKDLKNASDPAADKMLEPLAKVPVDPIAQEEADRFDANYCLHHPDIQILSIHPLSGQRFLLATKGSISAPTLPIRAGNKVDRVQSALFHPYVMVEVREGKIHPIRTQSQRGS